MLNNTHSNFSPINTLNGFTPTIPAYSFDMDVFSHDSTERAAVEAFIKKGFFTAYQAKVNISAPWLLAIKKGTFKAALGIRSASTETLFIEQYLSSPIECVLNEYQSQAARNEIAEICHLFSSSKKLTLPLLMTAAVSLYCRHYKYMVFAGTEHVLNLIKRTGVVMTHLAPAKQDKLIGNSSNDNWGSYYQTNPQVVAIELLSVLKVIDQDDTYQALFTSLAPKIAQAAYKLVE